MAVAIAATAPPVLALDLLEAYREATVNDSQVASTRAQADALGERYHQARAQMLPQIGASAASSRQRMDSNRTPTLDYTSTTYGVRLALPLYRAPNLAMLEQGKLQGLLGVAQFDQARQDLIVRVAQAYFDTLAAQDSLETLETQKRAITEQLASAKRNFEVGTATITDQQEAQARYDLVLAQEIAARNELEVRRAALSQLIGRPVDTLEVLRPGIALEGAQPPVETSWIERARADHFSVRQARISSEIARREIDRQRGSRHPTVDLIGSVGRSHNPSAQLYGLRADTTSIGVEVAIPLYTGGGISSRVREAAASYDRSLADLESARRAAELAARQAFLGMQSGLSQVSALEAAERSSQLALDSNQLGYQVGVRINIDVLNALQQLYTTRRDLARARYNVIIAGLQLEATAGTLDEEDVARVNALLVPPSAAAAPSDAPAVTPSAPAPPSSLPAAPATAPRSSGSRSPGSSALKAPTRHAHASSSGARSALPVAEPSGLAKKARSANKRLATAR